MKVLPTVFLTLLPCLPLASAEVSEGVSESPVSQQSLVETCAHFTGSKSLEAVRQALATGESPNAEDSQGNTPLLLLCRCLEYDYRYRTEPHFAKAVDEAFILLLRHRADALHENAVGCNTVFYLQHTPQLLKQLQGQKLLPRELAVRIPYDEAALLRYMRLRVAQAEAALCDASRAYVIRRYCAPAYARANKLLDKYMKAEMRRRMPLSAMEDTLAFLRLANAQEAAKHINALALWEHGEHFLEEVPEHFLQTLQLLGWEVAPDQLEMALNKLDSMLPRTEGDMIDCNAGYPMTILLEMRAKRSDSKLAKLLERFANSRDSRLAYTAISLQLQQRNLPLPDPETLTAIFLPNGGETTSLPETQRRLLECAIVDSAIRNADLSQLSADMVMRTRQTLLDMGMPKHAAILEEMVDDEGLTVGEESLHNFSAEYMQLPAPAPQATLARYILEHPELFHTPSP